MGRPLPMTLIFNFLWCLYLTSWIIPSSRTSWLYPSTTRSTMSHMSTSKLSKTSPRVSNCWWATGNFRTATFCRSTVSLWRTILIMLFHAMPLIKSTNHYSRKKLIWSSSSEWNMVYNKRILACLWPYTKDAFNKISSDSCVSISLHLRTSWKTGVLSISWVRKLSRTLLIPQTSR